MNLFTLIVLFGLFVLVELITVVLCIVSLVGLFGYLLWWFVVVVCFATWSVVCLILNLDYTGLLPCC